MALVSLRQVVKCEQKLKGSWWHTSGSNVLQNLTMWTTFLYFQGPPGVRGAPGKDGERGEKVRAVQTEERHLLLKASLGSSWGAHVSQSEGPGTRRDYLSEIENVASHTSQHHSHPGVRVIPPLHMPTEALRYLIVPCLIASEQQNWILLYIPLWT